MKNIFKKHQPINITPHYPASPENDNIETLECYARDKLIYDMHILNNFLEGLYEKKEYKFDQDNYSKDDKWVKICDNHIKYVREDLHFNYGNGTNLKCKWCEATFSGYMAGAKREYHQHLKHQDIIELETSLSMACMGAMVCSMFNAISSSIYSKE